MKTEKKWHIIDDCSTRKTQIFEEVLEAKTKKEAVEQASRVWDRMSEHDRLQRDDFYITLAVTDEEGCIDYEGMEEVTRIK